MADPAPAPAPSPAPAPAPQPAPQPSPSPAPSASAGGGDWFKAKELGLEEGEIAWIEGHKFPSLKDAIKSGMNAEKLARDRNAWQKPEKGKEKEWGGWTELGWEPDAAKYTFEPFKDGSLPHGMLYDQAMDDQLRTFAHENRIPLATARAARDMIVAGQRKVYDQLVGEGRKSEKELKDELVKKWGQDYPRNREFALRTMSKFGFGASEAAELEALTSAPRMVEFFHAVGEAIGEQNLPPLGLQATGLPSTMAGLRAELNRLQTDKEFMAALSDRKHARHADVQAQRQRIIDEMARLEIKAAKG